MSWGVVTVVCVSLGAALGAAGCGAKNGAGACSNDLQCGTQAACMMGTCLPRVSGRTLAVEIQPRPDSESARTEFPSLALPNLALGEGPLVLYADDKVTIEGSLTEMVGAAMMNLASNAHLSATVPSLLPGQGDVQFQTDLVAFKFNLGVGQSQIGQQATLWLIPDAKTPAQPPVTFAAVLDPVMTLVFPRTADMTVIRGFLHNSLDAPEMGFVARAYSGTTLVSNAVTTDDTGQFQLMIAPTTLPPSAAGMVRIEFTPASPADAKPRFVTESIAIAANSASGKPRTFRLPAFATPAPLRFNVVPGYEAPPPVPLSGFTVRFRTEIPNLPDGIAIYEVEGRTLDDGQVEVSLIPGTVADPRNYEITVVPAPDSAFATKCSPQVPVTMAGNQQQPQYMTLSLAAKVELSGTVRGSDSSLAVGANVTATPVSTGSPCPNTASAGPFSATTDRGGTYRMLVDPGAYRLDIEPAATSPLPRLTESSDRAFTVADGTATVHDVALPAAEVIEGDVFDSQGRPLNSAGIKIFEVLCQDDTCTGPSRVPPALRAQTRSDAGSNHFRAVLPHP